MSALAGGGENQGKIPPTASIVYFYGSFGWMVETALDTKDIGMHWGKQQLIKEEEEHTILTGINTFFTRKFQFEKQSQNWIIIGVTKKIKNLTVDAWVLALEVAAALCFRDALPWSANGRYLKMHIHIMPLPSRCMINSHWPRTCRKGWLDPRTFLRVSQLSFISTLSVP